MSRRRLCAAIPPPDEPLLRDEGVVQVPRRALGLDSGLQRVELSALAAALDAPRHEGLLRVEVRRGVGRGVEGRRHEGVPELGQGGLVQQQLRVVEGQAGLRRRGGKGGRGEERKIKPTARIALLVAMQYD